MVMVGAGLVMENALERFRRHPPVAVAGFAGRPIELLRALAGVLDAAG